MPCCDGWFVGLNAPESYEGGNLSRLGLSTRPTTLSCKRITVKETKCLMHQQAEIGFRVAIIKQ